MKMKYFKLKNLLFLAVGILFFTSCEKSENLAITDPISTDEAATIAEADDISDDVNNVIDDFLFSGEGLSSKSSESGKSGMLDCMTKTIVINGTTKSITLDFGEGCELPSGNVVSGAIIMNFDIDIDTASFTATYSFDNFYFNDLMVEGENTMVRVRENENGNPQSTLNFDVTVTWPEGEVASRKGTKVREWIEGHDTRVWGDNVFLITGNWQAEFRNGTTISANIVEPLRREMACRFIVSGIIELQKNDATGTLNFGDGTCDNKAIFTNSLGEETEITLRKRMR